MYPLRFPNNGIRAKVFVRKIYFKLRVMRLNRVELFYAFLLRFHNKRNEDGQLATAKPPARAANYGLATYKGATDCGQGPLHKGGKRLRHDHLQHGARRGGSAAHNEATGAAPTRGQPAEGRPPLPALRFSRLLSGLHACDYLQLYGEARRKRGGDSGTHDAMTGDHAV
ncbi:hypothetical protein GW17_00027407 [Ensete ventricosum]|nr:hypothetical protein GW17_00027407 [Ensete ventricosum]